jgi:hypothetical protein
MPTPFGSAIDRRRAALFADDLFGARSRPAEAWSEDVPEPRLPARPAGARGGKAFMESIMGEGAPSDWVRREDAMVAELVSGNLPDFLRRWVSITVSKNDESPVVTVQVLPDYLCVGKDDDYRHLPLDQQSAQKVADAFGAVIPTARICHAVWRRTPWSATIGAIERDYWNQGPSRKAKRGRAQTSSAAYDEHSVAIQDQMRSMGITAGRTVVGHKKDVVISKAQDRSRIAFHGFYKKENPYEPCADPATGGFKPGCNRELPSLAHPQGGRFSDYSQGVRLLHPYMQIDGVRYLVADVLKDAKLAKHISAEGTIASARVPPPP